MQEILTAVLALVIGDTSAPQPSAKLVWSVGVAGIAVIAIVDYLTGTELRVYPLYYLPVAFVAWYRGRPGALIAAVLCAAAWFDSNLLAGMRFSSNWFWAGNTIVQGLSFATVGILIATLRAALVREAGLSRIDPLTSLLNSRAFYEEARRMMALCRRKGRPITIAYIDLDNFKAVNDGDGHQAGDDLLRQIAGRLRASVRPSDVVARLGGDEFAILLPEVNPQEAAATVDRLRALLHEQASGRGPVTASIGGVTFTSVPDDVQHMVSEADARMYVAKSMGKNRVHLEVVG